MTDRPILFSAPMVRAHRDDLKTQTRRIIKDAPNVPGWTCHHEANGDLKWIGPNGYPSMPCVQPFAKGDRLWVRETFSFEHRWRNTKPRDVPAGVPVWYWADGNPVDGDWTKPIVSIHMPRWVSRFTDIVTDVRVQRLQEISEADCIAEGPPSVVGLEWFGPCKPFSGAFVIDPDRPHVRVAPRTWYRELWDAINGAGRWDSNPWVVALTFDVVNRNIDQMKEKA